MALRIEKAFGVKMETLLSMQARHDAYAMRQREGKIDVNRYRPLLSSRASRIRKVLVKAAAKSGLKRSLTNTVYSC
jgi:plasmid maintenance system antidote protein VapI